MKEELHIPREGRHIILSKTNGKGVWPFPRTFEYQIGTVVHFESTEYPDIKYVLKIKLVRAKTGNDAVRRVKKEEVKNGS